MIAPRFYVLAVFANASAMVVNLAGHPDMKAAEACVAWQAVGGMIERAVICTRTGPGAFLSVAGDVEMITPDRSPYTAEAWAAFLATPVSDGAVKPGARVWWLSTMGPRLTRMDARDWSNAQAFPECYARRLTPDQRAAFRLRRFNIGA